MIDYSDAKIVELMGKVASLETKIEELEAKLAELETRSRYSGVWGVEDVVSRAADDGYKITDEQAAEILGEIIDDHDANIGINWNVISYHIDLYAEKHGLEIGEQEDED